MARSFWILVFACLVNKLGTMVGPFLPLWLTEAWRLDEEQVTRLLALSSACALFGGPFGGWMADALGRRWTLILAIGLNGALMLLLPFAPGLAVLVGLILAKAFTHDMARPANSAAVADLVPPEERARAFGVLRVAINLGFGIGTLLGGILSVRSFMLLFVIDGGTALLAALIILCLLPETRPAAQPRTPSGRTPAGEAERAAPGAKARFALLCACGLVVSLMSSQLATTLPLSLLRRGGEETKALYGSLLALNALVVVLGQVPITMAIERFRPAVALSLGALCYGLGYGAVAWSVAPLPLAGAVVLLTLGEVLFFPLAGTVTAELAPPSARGRWFGVLMAAYGVGAIASPLLGGWILARHGDTALWLCSPPLGLVAAVGLLFLGGGPPRPRR